jgi:hypothetical protein
MSYVNDVLFLERYDDQQVQRIAAKMGHKADHWVHPGHEQKVWPILDQKVISPTYKGTTHGPEIGSLPGSGKRASKEFELHEPEKSPPMGGKRSAKYAPNTFPSRASLTIGKNTKLTVHEYEGHHFFHWTDENPHPRTGGQFVPSSGGTENSSRLYGSKEGFAAIGVMNPVRVYPGGGGPPPPRGAPPTAVPAGVNVRRVPMGQKGRVQPKKS